MALIADILLIAGTLAAGFYCLVLSRRLRQFTDLERGVGGAVAVLSAQVDDMTRALERARSAAGISAESLEAMTVRAEGVTQRLELLLAAMHDLPEPAAPAPSDAPVASRAPRMVWRRPRDTGRPGPDADPDDPVRTVAPFQRSAAREAAE